MPLDLADGKSTLVQVMAWCRQATSHYMSQCWPRSLWPYGIIRPQWVKIREKEKELPACQTGMSLGSHSWGYCPGTLSLCQVSAICLKIGHPSIKSVSAWSSNELQWLGLKIRHKDSSPSYDQQGDILDKPIITQNHLFGNVQWFHISSESEWYMEGRRQK